MPDKARKPVKRPTGQGQCFLGWVGIIIGTFLTARGFSMSTRNETGQLEGSLVAERIASINLGYTVFFVGVSLLFVGYLIRAIWFLPGDSQKHLWDDDQVEK